MCAREPDGLSEDSREPPALSHPYLWAELQQGEEVLFELVLKLEVATAGGREH